MDYRDANHKQNSILFERLSNKKYYKQLDRYYG